MFTLFRVMSGAQSDLESRAIDGIMDTVPTIKFAFVFFMVTSSWTLLSILTAVVSENMISTTGAQEQEILLTTAEEDRRRHVGELQSLFSSINVKGDGTIRETELMEFLKNKQNSHLTAKLTRVPTRDVVEVMRTLGKSTDLIQMDRFVECLLDVGNPVTEKSIMKVESLFLEAANRSEKLLHKFDSEHGRMSRTLSSVEDRGTHNADKLTFLMNTSAAHGKALAGLETSVQELHTKLDRLTDLIAGTSAKEVQCSNCGNVYMADALFCRQCGHKRGELKARKCNAPPGAQLNGTEHS